jgi:serine protease inhibitor
VKRIPNYLTAFLILLSLARCPAQTNAATATKTSPKVKEHPQRQGLYGPVIAANNQFAVRFFKAAYESSSQKNVLTAPASLSYAFALLLNGSAGSGRDQIADLFDLKDIPLDRINQGNAALRGPWVSTRSWAKTGGHSSLIELQAHSGFRRVLSPDRFCRWTQASTDTPCSPRRPTPTLINHWASLKTHGKLNNIIQDIGDDDFVLATVVDFKSRLVEPFSPSETHPGDFTGNWSPCFL